MRIRSAKKNFLFISQINRNYNNKLRDNLLRYLKGQAPNEPILRYSINVSHPCIVIFFINNIWPEFAKILDTRPITIKKFYSNGLDGLNEAFFSIYLKFIILSRKSTLYSCFPVVQVYVKYNNIFCRVQKTFRWWFFITISSYRSDIVIPVQNLKSSTLRGIQNQICAPRIKQKRIQKRANEF